MHLLPYNLCPCTAASAKVGGNGEGWRRAINFVSSEKQRPVDSDVITSSFYGHAFVTDQALLPLPLNVISLKEAVSNSRLLYRARAAQRSYRNWSSIAQVQKCCREA